MKNSMTSLLVGILFGAGLVISGMTQPAKVIAFLDVFGAWDPSLAFVMMGAIAVHFFAYRIQKHKSSPFFAAGFSLPDKKDADANLIIGSIIFGIGWAIGGFCPGPAITSLVSLQSEVFYFLIAMTAGMFANDWTQKKLFHK